MVLYLYVLMQIACSALCDFITRCLCNLFNFKIEVIFKRKCRFSSCQTSSINFRHFQIYDKFSFIYVCVPEIQYSICIKVEVVGFTINLIWCVNVNLVVWPCYKSMCGKWH